MDAHRRGLGPVFVLFLLVGCGGGEAGRLPDESGDLAVAGGGGSHWSYEGTTPGGPDLAGSRWRFVEAHCTEGPLDLSARGFSQELRIVADDVGLLLTYDQAFANDGCVNTIVQRAQPTARPHDWVMTEEVRVALPPTEACMGRMERERPGEVRRRGQFLEVLVQRSSIWCNGFEVKMTYAPEAPGSLEDQQIVRHYAAHFNRRDATSVAALFAEAASLLDPFQLSDTGGPTRLDGRAAVQQWYAASFGQADWVALQLASIEPGTAAGQLNATWRYMDSTLEEPFEGHNLFTLAAGEIYEAQVALDGEPVLATAAEDAEGAEATGAGRSGRSGRGRSAARPAASARPTGESPATN